MMEASTIPLPIVAATAVPEKAPAVFSRVAMITARCGERTRVETTVAMEFGASVQPLTNSAARISRITGRTDQSCSGIYSPLKKAHLRLSRHRLGGALPAGGVSQDRCNRVRVRCTVLTLEPTRLVHRSFHPPPAFRFQERGGLLSKPKASNENGSKNPLTHCFGRAKQPPERHYCFWRARQVPERTLPATLTA